MSLWIDKHRPTSLSKLDFHRQQADQLSKLVKNGDFPHLIVHGPPGAGKKTRVMCLLRELYGGGVDKLRIEHQHFETPSHRKLEVLTVASNYHIEVNPSDAGNNDRVVIQELLKTVAQTHQLNAESQKDFKVVVVCEADQLSKDAQHALRRTMEKYVSTCRLILLSTSCSRVIPAVRSRCLSVRVAAPSSEEIIKVLHSICRKEGVQLPDQLAKKIVDKSHRNLRRAILMCETCRVQQLPLSEDQAVSEPDWQVFLRSIADMIVKQQSAAQLLQVRTKLYQLLVHCVPTDIIFKELLTHLLKNCDSQLKCSLVKHAATYQHRMVLGSKEIFHLEAFIVKFMALYKDYVESSLMDM